MNRWLVRMNTFVDRMMESLGQSAGWGLGTYIAWKLWKHLHG